MLPTFEAPCLGGLFRARAGISLFPRGALFPEIRMVNHVFAEERERERDEEHYPHRVIGHALARHKIDRERVLEYAHNDADEGEFKEPDGAFPELH